MKNKLKSTKLWAAIIGVACGIAVIFGLDTNTIETVCGEVISVASVITYIATEGSIDRASVEAESEEETREGGG